MAQFLCNDLFVNYLTAVSILDFGRSCSPRQGMNPFTYVFEKSRTNCIMVAISLQSEKGIFIWSFLSVLLLFY